MFTLKFVDVVKERILNRNVFPYLSCIVLHANGIQLLVFSKFLKIPKMRSLSKFWSYMAG